VARHGQTFKDRAVARLLPPDGAAAEVVAKEVGIEVGPQAYFVSITKELMTALRLVDANHLIIDWRKCLP
jgi:hypothetical protein